MANLPRLVIAGQPLHIIHRGNILQGVFLGKKIINGFVGVCRKKRLSESCLCVDDQPYQLITHFVRICERVGYEANGRPLLRTLYQYQIQA